MEVASYILTLIEKPKKLIMGIFILALILVTILISKYIRDNDNDFTK